MLRNHRGVKYPCIPVNYHYRIVMSYVSKQTASLLCGMMQLSNVKTMDYLIVVVDCGIALYGRMCSVAPNFRKVLTFCVIGKHCIKHLVPSELERILKIDLYSFIKGVLCSL